jgi:hypothetical protein
MKVNPSAHYFPFVNWRFLIIDELHEEKTFSVFARFEWLTDGLLYTQTLEFYFHDDFDYPMNMN